MSEVWSHCQKRRIVGWLGSRSLQRMARYLQGTLGITPSMTTTDRLLELLPHKLAEHRAALDATPGLSSVQIIVQLDRFGPGRDKVLVRTESGQLTKR